MGFGGVVSPTSSGAVKERLDLWLLSLATWNTPSQLQPPAETLSPEALRLQFSPAAWSTELGNVQVFGWCDHVFVFGGVFDCWRLSHSAHMSMFWHSSMCLSYVRHVYLSIRRTWFSPPRSVGDRTTSRGETHLSLVMLLLCLPVA